MRDAAACVVLGALAVSTASAGQALADSPAMHTIRGEHFTIDVPANVERDEHGTFVTTDGSPLPFTLAIIDTPSQSPGADEDALARSIVVANVRSPANQRMWTSVNAYGTAWDESVLGRDASAYIDEVRGVVAIDDQRAYIVTCGAGPRMATSWQPRVDICDQFIGLLRVGDEAKRVVAPTPDQRVYAGDGWAITLPKTWRHHVTPDGVNEYVASARSYLRGELPSLFVDVAVMPTETALGATTADEIARRSSDVPAERVHATDEDAMLGDTPARAFIVQVKHPITAATGLARIGFQDGRELAATCVVESPTLATETLCTTIVRSLAAAPAQSAP